MSDSHLTRTAALSWTAVLVVPAVALLVWWFRAVQPLVYLTTIYASDWPFAGRIPLIALCAGTLLALAAKNRAEPPPGFPRHERNYAFLCAISFVALWLLLSAILGRAFFLNILSALMGVAVVLAAAALGLRLLLVPPFALFPERFASPLERLVLASALGLGLLALLMFFAGTAGLLSPWMWWIVIAIFSVQGAGLLRGTLRDVSAGTSNLHPVALAALVFAGTWCLAHAPLLWTPPIEYDILEYHLGAPAQYLRDGRVSFLNENIYAAFSANGEMLYLLGLVLGTNKWLGLTAAHTILFASWLLTLAGVYALTARLTARDSEPTPAPALATALFALTPLATSLVNDFYVEHFQALFHLAAVIAACGFLQERRAGKRDRGGWLALSGVLAGLCCGTKYTALLFTLAPLLFLIPLFCALGGSVYEALSAASSLAISALAMFAPWLLRNGILSHDPIFPLGKVMLRRAAQPAAIPDHLDHFDIATRAGPRSFEALVNALQQLFPGFRKSWFSDAECGPQLLAFALPGIAGFVRSGTGFLGAFFLIDFLLWFFFTYRLNRFMYSLLGPLAVLAGLGIANLWRIQPLRKAVVFVALAAAIGLGPLPMLFVSEQSRPEYISGAEDGPTAAQFQYYERGNPGAFDGWRGINALPPNSKVLLIGEAQTFYLDRTPVYSVVFNEGLLEKVLNTASTSQDAVRLLAAEGITHFYINYSEWLRLDASYALTHAAPGAPLEFAQIKSRRREVYEVLHQLLHGRQFDAYGRAWPADVFPAYLKISPRGYSILDGLIHEHTAVEKVFPDQHNRPTCELRRLTP